MARRPHETYMLDLDVLEVLSIITTSLPSLFLRYSYTFNLNIDIMPIEIHTLFDVLDRNSHNDHSTGITSYPLHNTLQARRVSYVELLDICRRRASTLRRQKIFKTNGIILLHFDDHLDNIIWFWSVLLAGCIPGIASPLPNDIEQRRSHLAHLHKLFNDPICLMRQTEFVNLTACSDLSLLSVEDLEAELLQSTIGPLPRPVARPEDLAALMLTSGSTGNAKAVELSHRQILASLAGKDSVTSLAADTSLLNWIGMDHVAALVETHLLAMYRGLDQIHIQPADVVADPLLLLKMITKHKVARTVAPNFLLASLLRTIEESDGSTLGNIDLANLTQLVSGGEANPVMLCAKLDQALQRLGAHAGVLQPAFGMTETCAGCTYNTECPGRDVQIGLDFASLGKPVRGFEMRVVASEVSSASFRPSLTHYAGRERLFGLLWLTSRQGEDTSTPSQLGMCGTLQIRGPMVFNRYYNNTVATKDAFTKDGWFDTGDQALLDATGNVHLIGRIKDHIRINGVTIVASDLETQLNSLALLGAKAGLYASFGYRPIAGADERLAVCYVPTYAPDDHQQRSATNDAIVKCIMHNYSICPHVLSVDVSEMQRSTLGKLPRARLRRDLEQGKLEKYQLANTNDAVRDMIEPRDETEAQLLDIFRDTFNSRGISVGAIGLQTPWYSLGITSIDLIRLRHKIELGMEIGLPLIKLLTCSTIEKLAMELRPPRRRDSVTGVDMGDEVADATYDPAVELRCDGAKTPLWLFHPGVGEVLVFIKFAKKVQDRPVYALRARGFNAGETFFENIEEVVRIYYQAIKKQQRQGPYALAGYSYGAMLAFETAKMLNNDGSGNQVGFLASFNLPPHIAFRMEQLDWTACAQHLAHFLGLLHDPDITDDSRSVGPVDQASIVKAVFDAAPQSRLVELELTPGDFCKWVNLAHAMQSMARRYEPRGNVSKMDVFYCKPLAVVAQSKREWLESYLYRWREVALDVKFHEVGGEHYTMLDEKHVEAFAKTFSAALATRGL